MPIGTATPAGENKENMPKREALNSGAAKSISPTTGSETEKFAKARNVKRRTEVIGVKS